MITGEPQIKLKDIIKLQDSNFNKKQVCIVTGVASGIGRATAIAASFNNLQVVGIDTDELGGKKAVRYLKN
jgi:3-hydroxybutyrate dehydrogenase